MNEQSTSGKNKKSDKDLVLPERINTNMQNIQVVQSLSTKTNHSNSRVYHKHFSSFECDHNSPP